MGHLNGEIDMLVEGLEEGLDSILGLVDEERAEFVLAELAAHVGFKLEEAWDGCPEDIQPEWVRPMIWTASTMALFILTRVAEDLFGENLTNEQEVLLYGVEDEEVLAGLQDDLDVERVRDFLSIRDLVGTTVGSFGRGVVASARNASY